MHLVQWASVAGHGVGVVMLMVAGLMLWPRRRSEAALLLAGAVAMGIGAAGMILWVNCCDQGGDFPLLANALGLLNPLGFACVGVTVARLAQRTRSQA